MSGSTLEPGGEAVASAASVVLLVVPSAVLPSAELLSSEIKAFVDFTAQQ